MSSCGGGGGVGVFFFGGTCTTGAGSGGGVAEMQSLPLKVLNNAFIQIQTAFGYSKNSFFKKNTTKKPYARIP